MSDPKFFSFRKPPDWRRGTAYQVEAKKDGLSVTREQVYRHLRRHYFTHPQLVDKFIDTVVDHNGRWFMLDDGGTIWRADLANNHIEAVITINSAQFDSRTRIAVTRDSLIALQPGPDAVLQAMSLDRAQIKWTTNDWYGDAFHALAVTADVEDGILVLASIGEANTLQVLRFDASGLATVGIPLPFFDEAVLPSFEENRFAITLGANQQGWLLDKATQRIAHLNLLTNNVSLISVSLEVDKESIVSLCSGKSDMFWGLLHTPQGASPYSLVGIQGDGQIVERGYTGIAKGNQLFVGKNGLYIWEPLERCVHTIQPMSETAIWKPFGRRMGVWISDALDSGVYETEWHKLVLDAVQENDTQINIHYYAAEDREVLLDYERVNLDDYIMDPDVLPESKLAALSRLWSKPLKDPQDALLLNAKGRYLWLFIELIGSEQHAPIIHSLEVHFPRSSYMDYLPSIYQRDGSSNDFLARYLSMFQTMLDETDAKIDQVTRTLEANHASGSSLRWLLGWLGIEAEDYWTEEQLRQLLKHAPAIYNLRGTKVAMETLISIYTGEKPIILEYEQVQPLKENPELGEVADRLYAADPHVFNVLVKAEHADTEMKRVTLQQLIEAYKPVFATCKLIILQPWVYMDLHSYLGMNTVLSEPTLLTLNGESSMPHHTITIDVGQDNRMDKHTRLGLNSRLE